MIPILLASIAATNLWTWRRKLISLVVLYPLAIAAHYPLVLVGAAGVGVIMGLFNMFLVTFNSREPRRPYLIRLVGGWSEIAANAFDFSVQLYRAYDRTVFESLTRFRTRPLLPGEEPLDFAFSSLITYPVLGVLGVITVFPLWVVCCVYKLVPGLIGAEVWFLHEQFYRGSIVRICCCMPFTLIGVALVPVAGIVVFGTCAVRCCCCDHCVES